MKGNKSYQQNYVDMWITHLTLTLKQKEILVINN